MAYIRTEKKKESNLLVIKSSIGVQGNMGRSNSESAFAYCQAADIFELTINLKKPQFYTVKKISTGYATKGNTSAIPANTSVIASIKLLQNYPNQNIMSITCDEPIPNKKMIINHSGTYFIEALSTYLGTTASEYLKPKIYFYRDFVIDLENLTGTTTDRTYRSTTQTKKVGSSRIAVNNWSITKQTDSLTLPSSIDSLYTITIEDK